MFNDGILSLRCRNRLIALCVVICFVVSYVPVTNHWLISVKGRGQLVALVASAMGMVRHGIGTVAPYKPAVNTMVHALKRATGQIKIKSHGSRGDIVLTEIQPDYPVMNHILRNCFFPDSRHGDVGASPVYLSISFPPDPPPPRI